MRLRYAFMLVGTAFLSYVNPCHGQDCLNFCLCWHRDAKVMDQALAMHDACLRAVLHQHYGYEVTLTCDQLPVVHFKLIHSPPKAF